MNLMVGKFSHVTKQMKCYVNCVYEKLKMVQDGQMKPLVITAILNEFYTKEQVQLIKNRCIRKFTGNGCDTAYKFFKCYFKIKKHFLE